VDANILGLEQESVVGVFNVSTGNETSINELVDTLNIASGKCLQVQYGEARKGDIENSCLCAEKAEKELKFKAKVELSVGLEETLRYFR
ncbi:MAG: UDP-glucose 4-epimerase, partial [Veillonella caviae]|nr:UDP-glucose 4-epimerase [Veillonella caviae]